MLEAWCGGVVRGGVPGGGGMIRLDWADRAKYIISVVAVPSLISFRLTMLAEM